MSDIRRFLFTLSLSFLLCGLPSVVHASLKAPRRVSSSPNILKPGEEDAFFRLQLKSSASPHSHGHAHRVVKKTHHEHASSHVWSDPREQKEDTTTIQYDSFSERPQVGIYRATTSSKTSPPPPSPTPELAQSSSTTTSSSSSSSPKISPPKFPLPFCAECDGCAVDWTKASITANSVDHMCGELRRVRDAMT